MTGREKDVLEAVRQLGDKASPRKIGQLLSFTSGYAEQLCNIMVRKGHLLKVGYHFEPAPE